MKTLIVLMMLTAVAVLAGCTRETATGDSEATATIARPEPMPGELGTDAMTQTVELEDGRSENEGGILTEGGGPDDVPVSSTAQTTTTTTTTVNPPPRRP